VLVIAGKYKSTRSIALGEPAGYGWNMEHRRLGSTGMYVSELTYGNWITHGSQVESEAAAVSLMNYLPRFTGQLVLAKMIAAFLASTLWSHVTHPLSV